MDIITKMDKRDLAKKQRQMSEDGLSATARFLYLTIMLNDLSGKEIKNEDIKFLTGISSKNTISKVARELENNGLLNRKPTNRGVVYNIIG